MNTAKLRLSRLGRTLSGLPLLGALALGTLAGCQSGEIDSGEPQELKETIGVLGDDRVSDVLKGHPERIPGTFQEVEKLFKIGRHCPRTDTKEIFVIEEQSSRTGGTQHFNTPLLPRAVITGCNTDAANPEAIRKSFELMVALISSPDAPGAAKGDAMEFTPVEMMALDRRTGTYNFYVFFSNGAGKPGSMVRVMRTPKGAIQKFSMTASGGSKAVTTATNACFTCHANGGPLMNELGRPWTNWLSVMKTLPKGKLSGETLSVVSEAGGGAGHTRSSFAGDLEQTMRAAIKVWVDGDMKTTGFAQMTLEGTAPGGLALLLKSVLCETEVNYLSSADTLPMELFADPDAVNGAGLLVPNSTPDLPIFQLPVRSEHDRRIEKHLMKRQYLSPRTVAAVRILDDERDLFSKARCALYPELIKTKLPTVPADVNGRLRDLVAAKAKAGAFGAMTKARAAYLAALVDPKVADGALGPLREAWLVDVRARFDKAVAQVNSATGRKALQARVAGQKDAVRKLFPGNVTPLPVME